MAKVKKNKSTGPSDDGAVKKVKGKKAASKVREAKVKIATDKAADKLLKKVSRIANQWRSQVEKTSSAIDGITDSIEDMKTSSGSPSVTKAQGLVKKLASKASADVKRASIIKGQLVKLMTASNDGAKASETPSKGAKKAEKKKAKPEKTSKAGSSGDTKVTKKKKKTEKSESADSSGERRSKKSSKKKSKRDASSRRESDYAEFMD